MRWKLLLRRLSVSAPRMSVRSHLPWPLRWAVAALVFGFSAAIALWAFEFGKDIAGLDRNSKEELATLRKDLEQLRSDHARARQVADTSESLLKTERAAQERLALQLRQLEAEKLALQEDLGFFERLLPTSGDGLQLRGLQAEAKAHRLSAGVMKLS
jgi:type II secretory pathway pseudopilin PulG